MFDRTLIVIALLGAIAALVAHLLQTMHDAGAL